MGTTAEKLQKVLDSKSQIKTAILNKGILVDDNTKFSEYSTKINDIEEGRIYDQLALLSTTLPTGRSATGCAAYNEYIYLFGGMIASSTSTGGTRGTAIIRYNTKTDIMTTITTVLPTPLSNLKSINGQNGYIYIFGGDLDSGMSSVIYKFKPYYNTTDSYYTGSNSDESIETLSTVLPEGNGGSLIDYYNGDIYIVGGKATTNGVYKFNVENETISDNLLTLSSAVYNTAFGISSGVLYYLGSNKSNSNIIMKIDLTNSTLSSVDTGGRLQTARSNTSGCILYGKLYIFFGNNATTSIEVYDPVLNTTTILGSKNIYGTNYPNVAIVNNHVIVSGGQILDSTKPSQTDPDGNTFTSARYNRMSIFF